MQMLLQDKKIDSLHQPSSKGQQNNHHFKVEEITRIVALCCGPWFPTSLHCSYFLYDNVVPWCDIFIFCTKEIAIHQGEILYPPSFDQGDWPLPPHLLCFMDGVHESLHLGSTGKMDQVHSECFPGTVCYESRTPSQVKLWLHCPLSPSRETI